MCSHKMKKTVCAVVGDGKSVYLRVDFIPCFRSRIDLLKTLELLVITIMDV